MIKYCTLLVFLSLFCFGFGGKLPSTFKVCKRNDPELEDCFAKAVKHALTYLNEPIPELGIPSLNPMKIEKIVIAPSSSGSVDLTQTFQNIRIYNVLDAVINKTEITRGTKDFKIVLYVTSKVTKVEYEYELAGKILALPLVGKGDAHVEFNDVEGTITVTGGFYEKKGKTYLKVHDVIVDYNPRKLKIHLDNLFNGDERLGNEMNKLLNENWKGLLEELKPSYNKAYSLYVKNIYGAVFDRVPYDELFPL